MNDKMRAWSMRDLYRRLLLVLLGKKKVTSSELGLLIARDALSHLGQSPTPFGAHDPVFWRLAPEHKRRFAVESEVAHFSFFCHLFMDSCGDSEFAARTVQRVGGQIALRMSENENVQNALGFGKEYSPAQIYEELADAFYERGNFYLSILKSCPNGDYRAFERAYKESLGLRQDHVADGLNEWNTLEVQYRKIIDRIWENMTPA